MSKCQRCGGAARMTQVHAKCSDMYTETKLDSGKEYEGYVPDWIGEYGDYVSFTVCRFCGTIQGKWPEQAAEGSKDRFKWGKCS